jgi:hypothetical protein
MNVNSGTDVICNPEYHSKFDHRKLGKKFYGYIFQYFLHANEETVRNAIFIPFRITVCFVANFYLGFIFLFGLLLRQGKKFLYFTHAHTHTHTNLSNVI